MILDHLTQSFRYSSLSQNFEQAFAFLAQLSETPAVGRHEIAGDEVFALVQRHSTKRVEEAKFEVHRRYADIQCILAGREVIHWAPLVSIARETMPYDVQADAALFAMDSSAMALRLKAGDFAVFFPEDAHAPSCAWGVPTEVLKVVVKVQL